MAKQVRWVSPPEDMSGFYIYCFTCKDKVKSKGVLRRDHLDHEVDWIRKTDGARYAFLPTQQYIRPDDAFSGLNVR